MAAAQPSYELYQTPLVTIKEAVYEIDSDTEKIGGNDDKIREHLFEAMFKVREDINEYICLT